MRNGKRLALAGLLAGAMVFSVPIAASASHGSGNAQGGRVKASGKCSASSTWKLKAKGDDNRIELEFEVDQNKIGDIWDVTITDNGQPVFQGTKTTHGRSGSFEVRRKTADLAGTDQFQADAMNRSTGETCSGSVGL